jgi:hypothetical protein
MMQHDTQRHPAPEGAADAITRLDLERIDPEGVLSEGVSRGMARSRFLGGLAAAVGLAVTAGAAVAAPADGSAGDLERLDFLLSLERMQAAFYEQAIASGGAVGAFAALAQTIAAIERSHVRGLMVRLGSQASPAPFFNFKGTTENPRRFVRTAIALEDLSTSTLAGILAELEQAEVVTTVAAMYTAEARHSAWIRLEGGQDAAPTALQVPAEPAEIDDLLMRTGFITDAPATQAERPPAFTG